MCFGKSTRKLKYFLLRLTENGAGPEVRPVFELPDEPVNYQVPLPLVPVVTLQPPALVPAGTLQVRCTVPSG